MVIASSLFAVLMAFLVLFIRMKAALKPVSSKKIILPPIFMSTGAFMFVLPMFRVSFAEVIEALLLGILFSAFLIKTSKFEVRDNEIYLKRSKAFVFLLLGLLCIRIALKTYLSASIDVGELSGMFWILAFGMIIPWRVAMYINYKRLTRQLNSNPVNTII